ncbi:LysR family transcriptional regulator [Vibrio parahaemolyticus]|uniref:LysR family transcriptional regulator n=1 Tax=Vibrio parahaemolyticus TaxID=670 RepID=UPI00111D2873|nr:LysR family transcriptional regulator [Vibrio parahaemolyticus]TOP86009.1 LysR family transcriptional regulator [Vibrio parahaemolyticus]
MREDLNDLSVFLTVAEESSFTRASVRLGLSQSAVSHAIRRLEESIGLRLLNRTSRRVSTTGSGQKLLEALKPSIRSIEDRIEEIRLLGDSPKGLVRLTTSRAAMSTLLWDKLSKVVRDYPDIQVEINLESRLNDLVQDRFDAAIRLREFIGPDMVAIRVGPTLRMAAVASPEYLSKHPAPMHPDELDNHSCLALRFNANSPPYDWEFEKNEIEITKKVSGPLIFSDADFCIQAAKEGHGIAFVSEPEVKLSIENGILRRLLEDWCPPFDGYYLCYSGRRQISSALRLIIDRLRYFET